MQSPRLAQKGRGQIPEFAGRISPHVSKPKARFIEPMLVGIAARQHCQRSRIARALDEPIRLKKTQDRLSYPLAEPGLGQAVAAPVVAQAAGRIGPERLIGIDRTDGRKTYAQASPYLAPVRNGSRGDLVPGYWCEVCALSAGWWATGI